MYLFTRRSQQNINDEVIDRGEIIKRTWRGKKLILRRMNNQNEHDTHFFKMSFVFVQESY